MSKIKKLTTFDLTNKQRDFLYTHIGIYPFSHYSFMIMAIVERGFYYKDDQNTLNRLVHQYKTK